MNGPVVTAYCDGLNREVGRDTQGFDGSTVGATKTYERARAGVAEQLAVLPEQRARRNSSPSSMTRWGGG